MAGKAYDAKNDFEQCAALRDWRLTHAGGLPNRRSDNDAEKSLASWLSKALQRRQRALSDRPSQRQLTPDEAAHLDSIVGMAIGEASANVPASSHARPSASHAGGQAAVEEWLGATPAFLVARRYGSAEDEMETRMYFKCMKMYLLRVRAAMSDADMQSIQDSLGADFFEQMQAKALQEFNGHAKHCGEDPVNTQELNNIIQRTPLEELDDLMEML